MQLDFFSGSLKAWNLSSTDCAKAKLKTKEWAKRNFGRKLNSQTLSEFDRSVLPHPNQTKPNTRPDPNEFLAERSLLTLFMCSLFLQTRPASMFTDRPCQPHRREEQATSISRLRNHPRQPLEHPSKKSPRQPKITKFPALGKQKLSVEHLKAHWEIPKVIRDILMIGTSNFSRIPWVSRDAQIVCSDFSPNSISSKFSNTALAPLTPVGNPEK